MGSLFSQLSTVAKIQLVEVGPFSRFRGLNYRKFGPKNEKNTLLKPIGSISCIWCGARYPAQESMEAVLTEQGEAHVTDPIPLLPLPNTHACHTTTISTGSRVPLFKSIS